MNRIALIIVACLPLFGFTSCRNPKPELPPAVLDVDPACWQACVTDVPEWAPENPDDPGVWDTYPVQVTVPMKAELDRCSAVNHRACQQALRRGVELKLYTIPSDD